MARRRSEFGSLRQAATPPRGSGGSTAGGVGPRASPKAVSGRTRYLRACLAFHPYPGVVPALFNGRGFGPPRGLTPASPCPGVARPASRPRPATHVALFGLAFAAARLYLGLAAGRDSLAHSSIGTPSHLLGAPAACGRTVSGAVSLPSRGAFHLSLTVLVRYRSQGGT